MILIPYIRENNDKINLFNDTIYFTYVNIWRRDEASEYYIQTKNTAVWSTYP